MLTQTLLNALPQGGMMIQDGIVTACNTALLEFNLPVTQGEPLPDFLAEVVESREGILEFGGNPLSFSVQKQGENTLLLLWEQEKNPDKKTMDGFFVRLRQELAVSGMGLESLATASELERSARLGEMTRAHYSVVRLLENMELLRGEGLGGQPVRFELVGYCQRLTNEVAPLLDATGCELKLIEKAYGLFIHGEEQLLQRLILGLVANAIQRGGKEITLQLSKSKNRCKIAIWDDCCGDESGDRREGQSLFATPDSLEMVVVRQLARELHGTVLVGKTAQGGEKVTLALPLAEATALPISAPTVGAGERYSRLLLELCDVLPSGVFRARDLI